MITESLTYVRDIIHAQLCYQMFITPIHLPIEKEYKDQAKLCCEYLENKRTEVIHEVYPRHHVIHRFIPETNPNGKKILIAHGWMSRAAYMANIINKLYEEGYEIYALDFPAHGEAKGIQLPWIDAVTVIKETINKHGPFYGVLGHSFGGSMLLTTLNFAKQLPEWTLNHLPQRAILIASPTQMSGPINKVAKKLKLSKDGYMQLQQLIEAQAKIDFNLVQLNHFVSKLPNIPFLCIHGKLDTTVNPRESTAFCRKYPYADLRLLPDADHVSVLKDERVDDLICDFMA